MPEPLPGTPATLTAISLLALVAGLLDASTYLLHGQVFANAMTGNAALLGIALCSHQAGQALRHITPLAAFAAGVVLGKWLLRRHGTRSSRYVLLMQLAVLGVAGSLPRNFPSNLLVAMLSLTGAMQITTIRRLGDIAFNITFMTGNLRAVFEGVSDALFASTSEKKLRHGWQQFAVVGLICVSFFSGAVLGAFAGPVLGNHVFWIAMVPMLVASVLLWRSTEGVLR